MYGNAVSSDLCNQIMSFESDEEVERLVTKIMDVYGLPNRFIIGPCPRVPNAVATVDKKGAPAILYNPDFLKKIKGFSFTASDLPTDSEDWGVLLVFAHEIGHHLCNHITSPHPDLTQRDMELEADERAGYILYLLNAPDLRTAQSGLRVKQVSEDGTYTHPPRSQRLDAFKKGWDKAAERFPRPGTIQSLNCSAARVMGVLTAGKEAAGVTVSVPYTGGDGGNHGGQSALSSGVAGLTATLAGGRFSLGVGTLQYIITGAPFAAGTAQFALNIGGKMCTLSISVVNGEVRNESYNDKSQCGAYVAPGEWKEFMCHNLGAANPKADPFTPSWEIIGGYWQWGRKEMAASGPSGPGASQTNEGEISGWNTRDAPEGSWRDNVKTANDPCPSGFRVPTKAQWAGVIANNSTTNVGIWSISATNYSSGKKFGNNLFLPAAGYKYYNNGALYYRGNNGNYWSSTENVSNDAWILYFSSRFRRHDLGNRPSGLSVRCVAE